MKVVGTEGIEDTSKEGTQSQEGTKSPSMIQKGRTGPRGALAKAKRKAGPSTSSSGQPLGERGSLKAGKEGKEKVFRTLRRWLLSRDEAEVPVKCWNDSGGGKEDLGKQDNGSKEGSSKEGKTDQGSLEKDDIEKI